MTRRTQTRCCLLSFVFATGVCMAAAASAQGVTTDPQTYCTYVTEQAQAQRDQLRTPSGVASFTQPDTGLPTQLVAGATLSLSSVKKAGITLDAARKNCELYKATTGVQQTLQYALPAIEKDALEHRLTLIDEASKSVDGLIADSRRMVDAQTMTRPMLLGLQMTKIKLDADRADTQSKISAIYVPALAAQPLKSQVTDKQSADVSEQRAMNKLAEQNNWDVALTVGAHQQINPFASGVDPYGEVTATYNFASRAVDRHLDRSADAYAEWKKVQESDVARGAEVLRSQVQQTIAAQCPGMPTEEPEGVDASNYLDYVAKLEAEFGKTVKIRKGGGLTAMLPTDGIPAHLKNNTIILEK